MIRFVNLCLIVLAVYFVQIFLCKIRFKIFGLILPLAFFVNSIINLVHNLTVTFAIEFSKYALLASLFCLFIYNIPTIILLAVYRAYKKKIKIK